MALAVFAALGGAAPAQGTRADYERARALPETWAKLDRPFRPQWRWLDGGARLWFVDDRGAEPQWVLVAADGVRQLGPAAVRQRASPRFARDGRRGKKAAVGLTPPTAAATLRSLISRPALPGLAARDHVPLRWPLFWAAMRTSQAPF